MPAASYQIVRFDQPRDTSSHTSWSSEEAQEAAFNETLAPLASLSAKHLHSVVKDYDTLGTDSFATSQLASLYDDLLLHRSLSPQQSPYKHARTQRDRLQDRLQKLQQQKTVKHVLLVGCNCVLRTVSFLILVPVTYALFFGRFFALWISFVVGSHAYVNIL